MKNKTHIDDTLPELLLLLVRICRQRNNVWFFISSKLYIFHKCINVVALALCHFSPSLVNKSQNVLLFEERAT